MLLVLLALGVNTAPAQVDQGCSTGQAIGDPTNNPGLVADCEALLGLKDELRGTATLNWSANLVMSGWDGIDIMTVNGAQRVTGIALGDKQLDGTLPAALGDLSSLQALYMPNNQLRGSIPKELGNLTNLKYLTMGENLLTGTIPKELGNLTNLQGIVLQDNRIGGSIPRELGNLSNLTVLSLSCNRLSGSIPSALGNLASLETLQLHENRLSGTIPSTLGNLSNLDRLNFSLTTVSVGLSPPPLGASQT